MNDQDRDELAELVNGRPLPDGDTIGAHYERVTAYQRADAIIAAGWRFDGSCRDCQANLSTNGGRHMFHCKTPEGEAQWAEAEEDQWPPETT